ncbi:MAG: CDP-alcohol phosphatidyltransferase family protein, partial [Christensenellaceae bacterium]
MKWNAPNIITICRIILIPVFIAFYFTKMPDWNIWAAIIFIVAAFTDWLDGYLARKHNQISDFGKLWDPIADKLLVLAALLLLMDWGNVGFIVVLIIVS